MDAVWSNFDLVLKAFWLTILLFVVSGLLSLLLGTLLAAMRVGPVPVLSRAGAAYVLLVRNTPLLVMFILVTVALPDIDWGIPDLHLGPLEVSNYFAQGLVALSVYTSSFVCEAVRSGINAVPLGQAEAARSVGMDFGQVMRSVVLPQAFRASIPPLASVQIALVKNTSVAAVFGIAEATFRMRYFTNNDVSARNQIFLMFAIGYVIIVEMVSFGSNRLERRVRTAR
ncbi:amino acid ABC transporter permease [Nocardioides marmoribigeumensis]|uniref:Glutamate transport system permease protein n=1 Tax=Nocardioides marmoribigeumensis TaxID=433649 RepID=A0ABU2BVK7_9ACTN|nr:amino acid ABC transporter permease [Nocardioides marmoribigeumensis]MDR7362301.1 glutamate transport system permease protein [Nocardioides marmoribigeumensis]